MKKIASILLPLTTLSIGASVVQPVIQAKEQFHSISKIENIEKLKIDDQYSVFIQKMSFKFVQQKIIDEFIKENGLHLVCEDLQMLNIKINGKPINPNDFLKIPVFTNMTFKLAGNSKYASGETDLLSVKLRNKINPILPPIVPDNYGLKTVDFAPVQISAEIFKSDDFSKVIQKKLISEIQNKNNMTFNTLDLFKFEISAKPDMNLGEHVVNAEYENSEIDADYYIPETNLQINYTVKDDKEVNINDVKSWLCFNDFNEGSPSITTLTTSADIGNIINQKLEQYNDTGLDNIEGKYGTLIIGDENSTLADVPQEVDKYFKLTPSLLQKSNKYGLYLNPFQNNPNADNKGYATTKPIDFTWISSDGEKEKFYDSMRLKIDKGNLLMPSQITKALTNLNIEFTLNKQQDLDNLENTIMKTIQNTDTQFYNKLIYSGVKKIILISSVLAMNLHHQ